MPDENAASLRLFNSLTRAIEPFSPVHRGEARVYTCGPTVYNYQHIGNMRAYIFADTLGRTLSFKGFDLTHVINITDVGHLTSDADAGADKMEKAAAEANKTAWDIAQHYTKAYWRDIDRLNIRQPAKWSIATDHIAEMIAFAEEIADRHCYELDTGLYFDTATVPDYGHLASQHQQIQENEEAWMRIDPVKDKRNAADFAIWRKTPPGETRQMEWDSPWGKGAPGWHLECSVMSKQYLGEHFDIHTGGIDHREIHHPNEIAQNQAHSCSADTGASIWMHNNFLVDRRDSGKLGKMSKSAGEFLTLQTLIDKGVHPLAYRLMCLQAHYRSELEFTWDNLLAALTRLKRLVMNVEALKSRHAELVSASTSPPEPSSQQEEWSLKQVQGDGELMAAQGGNLAAFDEALSNDLSTPEALTVLDAVLAAKKQSASARLRAIGAFDSVLGLNLLTLTREDLRLRPTEAILDASDIEAQLDRRQAARAAKNFAAADTIRDDLAAQGVEIMDGDPLRWDWRITP